LVPTPAACAAGVLFCIFAALVTVSHSEIQRHKLSGPHHPIRGIYLGCCGPSTSSLASYCLKKWALYRPFILLSMTVLSYDELNAALASCVSGLPNYPHIYADGLADLYATGCRPAEIFPPSGWARSGPDDIVFTPAKGNLQRTVAAADLSLSLLEFIDGANVHYRACTYSTVSNLFLRCWPLPRIYHESKPMDLYLFRYRYIKMLKLNGLTDLQIQDAMGWNGSEMPAVYYNAVLYY
jgi:hypothetical protein